MEDLIDTGTTIAWLKSYLSSKRCASVRICAFLDKKARRSKEDLTVDYSGYHCPDEFVVGYGMDFRENYRCLDSICVLKPHIFE